MTVDELIRKLIETRLRAQPVVILAGAGVSVPMIPPMSDIIDFAVDVFDANWKEDPLFESQPQLLTREGLQDLFERDPDPILRHSDPWKMGVMPRLLETEAAAWPGPQHAAMVRLLRTNLVRAVITPNWDSLIERAFRSGAEWITSFEDDQVLCSGLDERSRGFVTLRSPHQVSDWLAAPYSPPALIKLHGDVLQYQCVNDHLFAVSDIRQRELACPECGEKVEPKVLLPDSARRLSQGILAQLTVNGDLPAPGREHFNYLGAIVVVGFSARYDMHLVNFVMSRATKGTLIACLDVDPRRRFGGVEVTIEGPAEDLLPALADEWISQTRDLHESHTVSVPPLGVEPSAERLDALFGPVGVTPLEAKVLTHPSFVRLRDIKQLGRKQFVYSSADHSRFEHAVGTLAVVDELYRGLVKDLDRLRSRKSGKTSLGRRSLLGYVPTPVERELVRMAVLLHDFGHVWFSHLGEEVLEDLARLGEDEGDESPLRALGLVSPERSHEERAKHLLDEEPTNSEGETLLQTITPLLNEAADTNGTTKDDFFLLLSGSSRLGHLNPLVASNVDADKLEYLIRDANRTGQGGGEAIRRDKLAQSLTITEFGRTTLRLQAIDVVERVTAERYLMFQSVYHDERVRVIEESLARVLIDYLHPIVAIPDSVARTLLQSESGLLQEIRDRAEQVLDSLGKDADETVPRFRQSNFWVQVLDIIEGKAAAPTIDVWLLRPSSYVQSLPVDDAAEEVKEAMKSIRRDLASVFRTRYQYRAVFSLAAFKPHTGPEEIAISGESSLFSGRDVSPLIAGLQDRRQVLIRLGVVYFSDPARGGCQEEIEGVILRNSKWIRRGVFYEIPAGVG